MIIAEETTEWEGQEAVRKATMEWVEKANNNNVAKMLQENATSIDS